MICCMSSALSEPDGMGLGTLGFPEPVARKMTAEAGFTRFTTRDFETRSMHTMKCVHSLDRKAEIKTETRLQQFE